MNFNSPEEYLSYLQQKCGFRSHEFILNSFKEHSAKLTSALGLSEEEMLSELQKEITECPTAYQNPHTYAIIKRLFMKLDSSKSHLRVSQQGQVINLSPPPLVGSLSLRDFSAQIRLPNTLADPIITFSDGLFTFVSLISKVFTASLVLQDDTIYTHDVDQIIEHLNKNPTIIVRYLDVMFAYYLTNDAYRAKQYFIDKRLMRFSVAIIDSFELFVAGHEYAHHLLGHLSQKNQSASLVFGDIETHAIEFNWTNELNADLLGAWLTIGAMRDMQYDFSQSLLGIFICLSCLLMFEKFKNNFQLSSGSVSHPPASMRIDNLKAALLQGDHSNALEIVNAIFAVSEYMEKQFYILYSSHYQEVESLVVQVISQNGINPNDTIIGIGTFKLLQNILYQSQ